MKTIIIEDEEVAAESLESLISGLYPEISILAVLQSVEESVEWFNTHPMPDLVFMDIHLSDDSSFSIFNSVNITCPVIFTTAYDEYALKAFEVNSIDYLLKPIDKDKLKRAIEKYKKLNQVHDNSLIQKFLEDIRPVRPSYKSSILIPEKDNLIPIKTDNIAYIYIDLKLVKIVTFNGKAYVLEQTLDDLMKQLNPVDFYRANRQYIIARSAIKNINTWFGNKLSVTLSVSMPEKIYISKAKVREFKNWITE